VLTLAICYEFIQEQNNYNLRGTIARIPRLITYDVTERDQKEMERSFFGLLRDFISLFIQKVGVYNRHCTLHQ
jgi:hypothetical protein